MDENTDLARFQLEQKRIEGELEIKKAEIALKRDEFEAKKAQEGQKHSLTFSPLITGIIAAVVGLIGTGIGAYIQGVSHFNIELLKFESSLILKAIETGDQEKAKQNLLFLVETGFIKDKDKKIVTLAKDSERVPVLPLPLIEVEALKLKRQIDRQSQIMDLLRQLIDRKKNLDEQLQKLPVEERSKLLDQQRELFDQIEVVIIQLGQQN